MKRNVIYLMMGIFVSVALGLTGCGGGGSSGGTNTTTPPTNTASGVGYIDSACSTGNQYKVRDTGSNACVASSSVSTLYACQAATTGGSCGGSNKCTQSPGCSSGVQRCSDGICTAASTCDGSNIVAGCTSTPTASGVGYIDSACSTGNQYKVRDTGTNACVASSSVSSLYACQAATTGGSCGGTNKCTQSPGCSSGVQRCSDGFCTAASTCSNSNIVAGCI